MKNNKAVISYNTILILIISIIVVFFLFKYSKSLFMQNNESFANVIENEKEIALEKLKKCDDVLCTDPTVVLRAQKNKKNLVYIKIKNNLKTVIDCDSGVLDCKYLEYEITSVDGQKQENIILTGSGFFINKNEEQAKIYNLIIDESINKGTYYLNLILNKNTDYENFKSITVKIE